MIMQIMDHKERNEAGHKKVMECNPDAQIDEPFHSLDFDRILKNLGWRIVNSIMTNPSEKPM